jgi:hypothetical protein
MDQPYCQVETMSKPLSGHPTRTACGSGKPVTPQALSCQLESGVMETFRGPERTEMVCAFARSSKSDLEVVWTTYNSILDLFIRVVTSICMLRMSKYQTFFASRSVIIKYSFIGLFAGYQSIFHFLNFTVPSTLDQRNSFR